MATLSKLIPQNILFVLEYEDENYVYYVRAIPKYSVARTDKKVTTITKAGDGETSEEDSFLDDDQSLDDYFRT